MTTERQQIIRLLRQLTDADEARAAQAHETLVGLGERALGVVSAGLTKLEPRAHPALIRVLAEIGGSKALVRLMRFVFDARDDLEVGTTRGFAMQAIIEVAGPEDDARLFEFLRDMRHDPDELVRTYVAECFATLRDPRVFEHLREALTDPSLYVRESARKAFSAAQIRQEIHPLELEARDFFHGLTCGPEERRGLFERWLPEHREAFALASALVRRDDAQSTLGIQTLHALGNPAARGVALRHFKLTSSDADRAASLRLMADFLNADARPEEVRCIEQGLGHGDGFVQLAALEAAGRSGHEPLLYHALKSTRADNTIVTATAATALHAIAQHLPGWMSREVLKSVQLIRRRRAYEPNSNLLQAEAALLRTFGEFYSPQSPDAPLAQHIALDSLRDSHQFLPIAEGCLHALERLTPSGGYPANSRWHPGDASALVPLLDHPNASIQRRALEVIRRAAPGDTPNLCHEFERLLYADSDTFSSLLISAIIETNSTAALLSLTRWVDSQAPDTQQSLRALLQRKHANRRPPLPAPIDLDNEFDLEGDFDFDLERDRSPSAFKN
ncbi:HEAT repeat domain-containing protein [Bradymonas sediminis]|uniref:Uncharacterized protein n=1 Tax=Bradymonas sediminis TaxID=1548548 RepID=A0A2Z4FHK8_9DELT|nr:HEAT repeat domain-containing protein [Bradymonas sediminis]AWV88380.1 hypothetical protein DN745_03080 [Bradymonas sediminis]TDP77507.1 HEAT repeat protein [Bradymonas sediminis]